jgi:hypothetical protein
MSQKKNNRNEAEYVSTAFVNSFWNQFEDAAQLSRQFLEDGYEVSLKTFDNVTNFNSTFRNSFKSYFDETKKANEELVNFMQPKIFQVENSGDALTNQWQDLVNQWEKIMLTPTKSTFDFIDRLEKKSVENSKSFLENLHKRTKEGSNAFDEYYQFTRKSQEKFAIGLEDQMKELVGSTNK